MEISRSLTTDLDLLTDALNDPDVDLAESLRLLAADTRAAVPSFLGLSLLISGGSAPSTLTTFEPGAGPEIAASLLLPLLGAADADGRTVSIVLYATTAGAFVDLAADLSWLTGIGTFRLDEHLRPPPSAGGPTSVRAESFVNQAIGMLMAGGLTPEAAERRLDDLAEAAGTDRGVAASSVLQATSGRDNPVPRARPRPRSGS